MTENFERIEINGAPARVEDLRLLVQTNYGHFSAMRVEERLRARPRPASGTTRTLRRANCSAAALERERVRGYLRHAIGAEPRAAVAAREYLFARAESRSARSLPVPPDVLVTRCPRVAAVNHAHAPEDLRTTRAIWRRSSMSALFHFSTIAGWRSRPVSTMRCSSTTSAASAKVRSGISASPTRSGIVWPDAPRLTGVSMQLLQQGMARCGVPSALRAIRLDDLAACRSAFFSNASVPMRPIASIDAVEFAIDEALLENLRQCYESNPWQRI